MGQSEPASPMHQLAVLSIGWVVFLHPTPDLEWASSTLGLARKSISRVFLSFID